MACKKLGVWAAQSPLSALLECQYPLSGTENDQLGQRPVLWAALPVQLGAVFHHKPIKPQLNFFGLVDPNFFTYNYLYYFIIVRSLY